MTQCIAKISSGRQCLRQAEFGFKTCKIVSHRSQESIPKTIIEDTPVLVADEVVETSGAGSGDEAIYHSVFPNYQVYYGDKGESVQFEGGVFKTNDKAIIKKIEALSIFGGQKLIRL